MLNIKSVWSCFGSVNYVLMKSNPCKNLRPVISRQGTLLLAINLLNERENITSRNSLYRNNIYIYIYLIE